MTHSSSSFATSSRPSAFASEDFINYISSNIELLNLTCAQIPHLGVRKEISLVLTYLKLKTECTKASIENTISAINFIDQAPDIKSLRLAYCILDNIKNAIPDHKMTPSLREHALRLGQYILSQSEMKKEFEAALYKIKKEGSNNYAIPNGIFICYEKSKKPYLAWVDKFVTNLQSHLNQGASWCDSTYDIHDSDIAAHLNKIRKYSHVLLIGTEALFENNVSPIIKMQRELLVKRISDNKLKTISILISGDSVPKEFGFYQEWQNKTYFQNFCQLLSLLYGSTGALLFHDIWDEFLKNIASHRIVLETGLDESTIASFISKEDRDIQTFKKERELITRSLFRMPDTDCGTSPAVLVTQPRSKL